MPDTDQAAAGAALLDENARRWRRLRYPYDPVTGEGSHEERRPLRILPEDAPGDAGVRVWHVPVQMAEREGPERDPAVADLVEAIDEAGSLLEYAAAHGLRFDVALAILARVRCRMDFEFWCVTCVKVKADLGGRVPFRLRHPQRLYLRCLLDFFWSGQFIDVVLLKARQWGGSTITQVFFNWIQSFHRVGWNSAIVADVQAQAGHVRQMFETLAEEHPPGVIRDVRPVEQQPKDENGQPAPSKITLRPYARMQTVRRYVERDAYIGLGSVQEPDGVRSFTFHLLHLSEVGLWQSTEKQSAEALAQSLIGGVASGRIDTPCAGLVMESTAKGVGSFFHDEWTAAASGESSRTPFFVPWYEIDKYHVSLETLTLDGYDGDEPEAARALRFVETLDKYERYLWKPKAEGGEECTLEQILWYRRRLKSFKGRRWMIQSENPTTPTEAFQSTGERYYTPDDVGRARTNVKPPATWARLAGEGQSGPAALKGLRLVEMPQGDERTGLRIWRRPHDSYSGLLREVEPGRAWPIRDRFVAFADPGGKTDKADWSVVVVVDRAPMLFGAPPEVVAVDRFHLRADLAAWRFARLAAFYHDGAGRGAELAVEVNRYGRSGDAERGFEPEWDMAVIEEIAGVYKRLYHRQKHGEEHDAQGWKVGFWTDPRTKPMLVNTLDRVIGEGLVLMRSRNACDEMDVFESKTNGKLGARDKCHDDELIATAGASWLAIECDTIPAPRYVEAPDTSKKRPARVRPSRV